MRKKIAAFIGEIGREFQAEFVRTLSKIANEHDYDIFVFSNFGFYTSTHLFDAAEIDLVKLPVFSEFEGVILIPDTFDLEGMEEMLIKRLEEECTCPVVSVRSGSDKTYRILIDDYKTTYNLTKHFIDDHKFTKICYMSGPLSAPDAVIRRNGFKDAMEDSGLAFNSSIEFEGDYWVFKGQAALEHFMKAYGGVPEAIICANDHMAINICEELKRLGYRIPDDVCVSGFDEIVEGQGYEPALTTVRMPTVELARAALDIIEQVNSGKNVPRDTYLSGQIRLKGSCGCNADRSDLVGFGSVAQKIIENYEDIRMSGIMTTDVVSYIKEEDDECGKISFVSVGGEKPFPNPGYVSKDTTIELEYKCAPGLYCFDGLPHSLVDEPEIEATCSTPGRKAGKRCTRCNEFIQGGYSTLCKEHEYENDVNGSKICKKCNAEYTESDIEIAESIVDLAKKDSVTNNEIKAFCKANIGKKVTFSSGDGFEAKLAPEGSESKSKYEFSFFLRISKEYSNNSLKDYKIVVRNTKNLERFPLDKSFEYWRDYCQALFMQNFYKKNGYPTVDRLIFIERVSGEIIDYSDDTIFISFSNMNFNIGNDRFNL